MRRNSVLPCAILGLIMGWSGQIWSAELPRQQSIIPVSENVQTYSPPEPSSLAEFALIDTKELVRLPGEPISSQTHVSDVRMILKATSVAAIEEYLIVQFLRGCQFVSTFDGKRVQKDLSISRVHMGKTKTFKHVGWEIDSDSLDPAYSSYDEMGRLALYRWNRNPASFDPEKAIWWANAKPPHPVVFLTDMPGGAFRSNQQGPIQQAKNTSLEFRTCLFKAKDLPTQTDANGSNIDLRRAIKCFAWEHKYVYDFQAARMTTPKAIDPICR